MRNMSTKKVLISILILLGVGGGVWAGTYAYFTARRTTSANRFAAGTIDLNVLSNGAAAESFVLENLGENGNISGAKVWTVKNVGTLPARLLVRLKNVVNAENGCNDPETEQEPACASDSLGELGAVVNANVSLDGTNVVSTTLATAQQGKVGTDWNALTPIIIMQPGEERTVGINWETDEASYGNEVQSDSVGFDIEFRLIQQISGPTQTN